MNVGLRPSAADRLRSKVTRRQHQCWGRTRRASGVSEVIIRPDSEMTPKSARIGDLKKLFFEEAGDDLIGGGSLALRPESIEGGLIERGVGLRQGIVIRLGAGTARRTTDDVKEMP